MSDLPRRGDPRVLLVMNVVLSAAFAWLLLVASGIIGLAGFSWQRFVALTALLVLLTHVVTMET